MTRDQRHVLDDVEGRERVAVGAVQGQPQEHFSLTIASLHLGDGRLEVGPGGVDPVPAEVAQRRARNARPGRCRERERRNVAQQDVDAVFDQQPGLGIGVHIEIAGEVIPAPTCLVDVQIQPVVLRHADIQRPTR